MEKILKRKRVFKGKVVRVEEIDIDFGKGKTATFELVKFNTITGVSALAIDQNNNVILAKHFHLAPQKRILTLPTGGLEKGDNPELRMQQELQEEIGYKAGKLTLLTRMYAIPGYIGSQPAYIFLALNLTPSKLPGDEHETIEVVKIPFKKALQMVKSGKISDGRTVLALLFYSKFFKK